MEKSFAQYAKTSGFKTRKAYKNLPADAAKLVCILIITVTVGEVLFRLGFGNHITIMLYLLSVQIISAVTTAHAYIYGILAATIATFAYDFQITEPRMGFSFTIELPVTLMIMLTVTIVTGTIMARVKADALAADKRERQTQQIYEINQKLLASRSLASIVSLTGEYASAHLQRAATLHTENLSAFDGGDALKFPVSSNGSVIGLIVVERTDEPMTREDVEFVGILAGQAALALELQHSSDMQARIAVEAEREKVRGTLLRSISHDLRTPLTGIIGASSAILEQNDLAPAVLRGLARDINQYALWLVRMVENILIITRITGEKINVKKEAAAAEEVISDAVSIVRTRFSGHIFNVQIPDELLIVPMDSTLISQVIINLLENAAKNSPESSPISISLSRDSSGLARFDVIDNGKGIPREIEDNLFEDHFARGERTVDMTRGMGLGLLICKTIIHAHGGVIEGGNRETHGAKFSFSLPLQEVATTNEQQY